MINESRFANWNERVERMNFFMKNNHYAAQCVEMKSFKDFYGVSERELAKEFNLSKTEINRMISIAKISPIVLHKAREFGVDKYVLVHLAYSRNEQLAKDIIDGKVKRYNKAKKYGKSR